MLEERPLENRCSSRFSVPDSARFPALALAYRAIERGGTAGAVLNAANEAAVEAFLEGAIAFGRIPELVSTAMDRVECSPPSLLRGPPMPWSARPSLSAAGGS